MSRQFTLDDLIAALRGEGPSTQQDLSDFATSEQWAARLGCSQTRMLRLIRDGMARGLCRHRRAPMADLGLFAVDGRRASTNVYAFRLGEERGGEEGDKDTDS